MERRQEPPRRHLLGGNAEVEIDVRVHAGEHVLHEDRSRKQGAIEGHAPAVGEKWELRRMKVPVQRREVAAGENDVEPLHPRAVIEEVIADSVADGDRDPLVERREISEPRLVGDAPVDDVLNGIDDLVDGGDWKDRRQWRRHLVILAPTDTTSRARRAYPDHMSSLPPGRDGMPLLGETLSFEI